MQLQDFMPPKGTTITITRELTTSERKRQGREKIVDLLLNELRLCKLHNHIDDVVVQQHDQKITLVWHPEVLTVINVDLRYYNKNVWTYHHDNTKKFQKTSKEYLMQLNPCTCLRAIKMLRKSVMDRSSQKLT